MREPQDDSSAVTSSTVFDFNGDGRAEVVYNDEQHFLVFEGATGAVLLRESNPSRTRTEQPVVADVDNDGNAEIVFSANKEANFAGNEIDRGEQIPGVEIWSSGDDSWVGARAIWNQHTYHIDNVNVAGAIPAAESPSWTTHNTYRLNLADEEARAAPDLSADPRPALCEGTTLRVCVEVRNLSDVRTGPNLRVVLYEGASGGGNAVGEARTTRNLERGGGEEVCVDWENAPTDSTPAFVRIDVDEAERECDEENNLIDLGSIRCSPLE